MLGVIDVEQLWVHGLCSVRVGEVEMKIYNIYTPHDYPIKCIIV